MNLEAGEATRIWVIFKINRGTWDRCEILGIHSVGLSDGSPLCTSHFSLKGKPLGSLLLASWSVYTGQLGVEGGRQLGDSTIQNHNSALLSESFSLNINTSQQLSLSMLLFGGSSLSSYH